MAPDSDSTHSRAARDPKERHRGSSRPAGFLPPPRASSRLPDEVIARIVELAATSKRAGYYDFNARHLRSSEEHAVVLSCALVSNTWYRASERFLYRHFATSGGRGDSAVAKSVVTFLSRAPWHCHAYVKSISVEVNICWNNVQTEATLQHATRLLVDCLPRLEAVTLHGPNSSLYWERPTVFAKLGGLRSFAIDSDDGVFPGRDFVDWLLWPPTDLRALRELHIRGSPVLRPGSLRDICTLLPHLDTLTFMCTTLGGREGSVPAGRSLAPLRHLHVSFTAGTAAECMGFIMGAFASSLQTLIVEGQQRTFPATVAVARAASPEGCFAQLDELVWCAPRDDDHGALLEVLDGFQLPRLRHLGIIDEICEYVAFTRSRTIAQLDTLTLVSEAAPQRPLPGPNVVDRARRALRSHLDGMGVALHLTTLVNSGLCRRY